MGEPSVAAGTDNAGALMPTGPATPRLEHMSDLSPSERLAKLRAVEAWLDWQLRDTRRRIEQVEQQARAGHYVTEQERRAGKPVGVTIHAADCSRITHIAASITATEAQYALLKDPSFNHACEHCRPDLALGFDKE